VIQRVSANGTLNPVELVNVGTQISGTVRSLLVDFNSQVKAGQLLAELDPSILEAQIRASEASLASAKATLRNAELLLKRNENLKDRGFISEGALDGLRKDVDTASAQVMQIEAQLSRDKTNLGYSKIRSPIDGIVVNRGIDVGQTVAASFQTPTLFQIARDLTKMQIDTSVSEADVGAIVSKLPVRFTVDAFRDREFNAAVRMVRLNPTTVQNVVTYNVVIDVDNKDGVLLPGMTAQVSIVTSRKDNVLRVPAAALRFRPPEEANAATPAAPGNRKGASGAASATRVYVQGADGALVPREIKSGISDGRFVEVLEGLSAGELVVTRAASTANAGQTTGFRFRMF
jgi:HlyD family secretion protein